MRRTRAEPLQGFGARLAELRRAAGLTQVELAEAVGISQRMVAYYESAEDYPLAQLLRHLSSVLGVTTDELLGVAPPKAGGRLARARKSGARKA